LPGVLASTKRTAKRTLPSTIRPLWQTTSIATFIAILLLQFFVTPLHSAAWLHGRFALLTGDVLDCSFSLGKDARHIILLWINLTTDAQCSVGSSHVPRIHSYIPTSNRTKLLPIEFNYMLK
ncbi:hypothetical protein, partial [Burkholderia pseudomallei]|uniref:hypothetical protein n=1 Tax=Burkholderia pseudomallei TaxID=28450 RepID=UPI0021F6B621